MRYILQILVMFGDAVFFAMCYFVLSSEFINLFDVALVLYCCYLWWKQGGFMAWRPCAIREFLKNAKEAGL